MSKMLLALSAAVVLTAVACSNPNTPRLPESDDGEQQQDTTPTKTGDQIPAGALEQAELEPGPSAFLTDRLDL